MGKGLEYFSKNDIKMANEQIKASSISLILKEMQIKTTIRYHLTLARMGTVKNQQRIKQKMTSVDEDVEKQELLPTVSRNVKLCNSYRKWYGNSSKNVKIKLPI